MFPEGVEFFMKQLFALKLFFMKKERLNGWKNIQPVRSAWSTLNLQLKNSTLTHLVENNNKECKMKNTQQTYLHGNIKYAC